MFSSGNTNNLAKVNDTNISTQEFIDYYKCFGNSSTEYDKQKII